VTGAVLRRLSEDDLRDLLGVSSHAHRTLVHEWLLPHRPPPPPPQGIDLWAVRDDSLHTSSLHNGLFRSLPPPPNIHHAVRFTPLRPLGVQHTAC
jgi:hypothetical protein